MGWNSYKQWIRICEKKIQNKNDIINVIKKIQAKSENLLATTVFKSLL